MSVVVRMEMPKGCGYCRIAQFGYCGITHEPVADAYMGYPENRPKTCPILAVLPENHGRLVDADELSKYWKCRIALMNSCSGKRGILESVEASTLKSCIEDMGSAKIIVPAAAERSET